MQQDNTIVFQSSTRKKVLYGILTVLCFLTIIAALYLIITGKPENLFSQIARLLFGLLITTWTTTFFLNTGTRLVFQNNTLQKTVFGRRATLLDLTTLRIAPFRSHTANAVTRLDGLLFTDSRGSTCSITAYSIAALSKQDRVRLLQILEPFILRDGAVQENDKPGVQRVLSGFNPDSPIKLTADAEEFARKAKKLVKISKTVLIVGVAPITILILLVTAGFVFTTVKCDALLAQGKETTATITTLEPQTNKANELSTLRLELTYNVNGKAYNKEFHVGSQDAKAVYDKLKKASSVQIRYLPDDPKTIEFASDFSDGTANECKS